MLEKWNGYYDHFNKPETSVRDGCHPLIFKHGDRTRNAIVLIHGLTDSPHFMRDIGEYFCAEMGFDVYIPLLRSHGLKDPQGMKDASAEAWKADVRFAVKEAQKSGGKISIGGLSTGGTLSVEMALNDKDAITGGVFLFSAALGLATPLGNLSEILLRTPWAKFFDHLDPSKLTNDSPSGNPYRYSQMDLGGSIELSRLIREIDDLIDTQNKSVTQPLFAAHSEADTTAAIDRIEKLVTKSITKFNNAEMFRIGQSFGVPHASVVLKNPIFSINNSPLEPQNPFFQEMMSSINAFTLKYNLI
jgi:esterase/lipase